MSSKRNVCKSKSVTNYFMDLFWKMAKDWWPFTHIWNSKMCVFCGHDFKRPKMEKLTPLLHLFCDHVQHQDWFFMNSIVSWLGCCKVFQERMRKNLIQKRGINLIWLCLGWKNSEIAALLGEKTIRLVPFYSEDFLTTEQHELRKNVIPVSFIVLNQGEKCKSFIKFLLFQTSLTIIWRSKLCKNAF